jgi:hypothetical protein
MEILKKCFASVFPFSPDKVLVMEGGVASVFDVCDAG